MNVLVDTHLLLWTAAQGKKLSFEARHILSDQRNSLWVSVVSIWEVAIKRSLEKPDFRIDAGPLRAGLLRSGYTELAVESRHVMALVGMPYWHNDPFDRLLVAQAHAEGMVLLTTDRGLAAYGTSVLVVG